MIGYITEYKEGNYPFPKHDIDPKKKDAKWHCDYTKAIFGAWLAGKTGVPYSQVSEMAELRRYGEGKQDPERYMNILLGPEEEGKGDREGWLNVNWGIFSVADKFVAVIMGMMEAQDHDAVATAVDKNSGAEREALKWATWFKSQYRDKLNQVAAAVGQDEVGKNEYLPESIQELELYENMGGFKLKKEEAIEKGLDYTFYISEWPEIKKKIIEDFVNINCAACKDYVDPYTQKVRTRYVDPLNLVIQDRRANDTRQREYGGEIIKVNIVDLKKYTNLTEDQLREIARKYNSINGNRFYEDWNDEYMRNIDGSYKYDNFWIDVMDAEWMSNDQKYRTKRTNNRGESIYHESKWGKVYDADKKKTSVKDVKVIYRAKLILGTDFVYDWGYQFDVPRKGKKEVELSYHFYKLPGRSIIDRITNNLDNLQLAWLKFQNNLAMAAAPGLAVEWTTLQNMTLGGEQMEPLDILSIRRDTGDLVYRVTTHRGMVNSPHAGKPVQELEGGMGRSLDEFIMIFETNLKIIRDFTGVNEIADATTPNPEQSVGGSKMAVAATNNVLRPLYSGYINIKQNTSLSCALRLQLVVKYNKKAYTGYYPVIGKAALQLLSIGTEVLDTDWGIKIQVRPTEEMKDKIRNVAIQAMQPDREGYTGLEMPEYLMIERMLESGNLKMAEAMLAYLSQKNKERQEARQKENMELGSQRASKVQAEKAQQEEAKAQGEHQRKKDYAKFEHDLDLETEAVKHGHKLEEIQVKGVIDTSIKSIEGNKEEELVTNTA